MRDIIVVEYYDTEESVRCRQWADKKKGWMWQSVGLLVALQESGWWALRNHWEILNVRRYFAL